MTDCEQFARTIESLQTRYRLARYPNTQAEAIAYHYSSLATTGATLKSLVESKQYGNPASDINKMIDMLVEDIKEAHFKAFGIELEWKEKGAIPIKSQSNQEWEIKYNNAMQEVARMVGYITEDRRDFAKWRTEADAQTIAIAKERDEFRRERDFLLTYKENLHRVPDITNQPSS